MYTGLAMLVYVVSLGLYLYATELLSPEKVVLVLSAMLWLELKEHQI